MLTSRFTFYKTYWYTTFLHFMSQKYTMTLSFNDYSLLEKPLYKNNDCAQVVLQKFRTFTSRKKRFNPKTVRSLSKRFSNLVERGKK